MEERVLPEGFKYADDMPVKEDAVWHPLPPEAYKKPRRRRIISQDQMRVYNLREALQRFRARRMDMAKIHDVNFEGARIGTLFINTITKDRYLVMFKRHFYIHFSNHFPQVPEKGYGIITAKKIVGWASEEDIIITAIFPSGRCYSIHATDFWLYYEKYGTDCVHAEGEIASPLKMWKRVF